jgi:GT2 family glycosyltransferase
MSRQVFPDIPWPIILVDATGRTISSDVSREPGAGALVIYWANDIPIAQQVFAPDEPLPDDGELLRRGREHAADFGGRGIARQPDAEQLSLIIPTRNRPQQLRRCLEALLEQDAMPGEVIVVDNAPESAVTREVVGDFAFATYVGEKRAGLDQARNAGISVARKPLLAFCDDDVVLHPAWATRITAGFEDPAVTAITGLVLPLELRTAAQRLFEFHWGFGRGFSRIDFRHGKPGRPDAALAPWTVGAGASMAFRREAFDRLGGFDTRLDAGAAGCSGDSEMWYRILMQGGLCRYLPEVVAFHQHRATMDGLKSQIRAYMRGHVAALLVQHQRYGDRANLRRAFLHLPRHFGRRVLRNFAGRGRAADVLLMAEILGSIEGVGYFLQHPHEQPTAMVRRRAALT